jgi:hypothetical protein
MWFDFLTTLVYNIILRRTQWYIIINVNWFSCKAPLFLSDFNEIWIYWQILENPQISNFVKIRPAGAELFHADRRTDGQTDMTKLIVAFRYFANVPNYYPKDCSRGAMYLLYDINRIFKGIWCVVQFGFPCQNFVFTCNVCWNGSTNCICAPHYVLYTGVSLWCA